MRVWSAMQLSWVVLALLALRAASEAKPQEAEWRRAPSEFRRTPSRPLAEVFEPRTERRRSKPFHKRVMTRPRSEHLHRTSRSMRAYEVGRAYDVPQIRCPAALDGMERFSCPSLDRQGRYRCIDDHVLCDGFIDCPNGEDEEKQHCLFYKTTKAHLDVLADALLRWVRGR